MSGIISRAHFEEGRFAEAAIDFKSAAGLVPGDPYNLVWLYLVQARVDRNPKSTLKNALKDARGCDLNCWPSFAVLFYQKKSTPKAVIAAAASPDSNRENRQLCQAHFSLGEYELRDRFWKKFDLLHLGRQRAIAELEAATKTCRPSLIEYQAVGAELKRLGHPVDQSVNSK